MVDALVPVRDEARDDGVAAAVLPRAAGVRQLLAREVEHRVEQLVLLRVGAGALRIPRVTPAVDAVPMAASAGAADHGLEQRAPEVFAVARLALDRDERPLTDRPPAQHLLLERGRRQQHPVERLRRLLHRQVHCGRRPRARRGRPRRARDRPRRGVEADVPQSPTYREVLVIGEQRDDPSGDGALPADEARVERSGRLAGTRRSRRSAGRPPS